MSPFPFRNAQLAADRPRRVFVDLSVARHGTLPPVRRIDPNRMAPPLSLQTTPESPQVPDQILPLHDTAPVGTSRTPVLARRCK